MGCDCGCRGCGYKSRRFFDEYEGISRPSHRVNSNGGQSRRLVDPFEGIQELRGRSSAPVRPPTDGGRLYAEAMRIGRADPRAAAQFLIRARADSRRMAGRFLRGHAGGATQPVGVEGLRSSQERRLATKLSDMVLSTREVGEQSGGGGDHDTDRLIDLDVTHDPIEDTSFWGDHFPTDYGTGDGMKTPRGGEPGGAGGAGGTGGAGGGSGTGETDTDLEMIPVLLKPNPPGPPRFDNCAIAIKDWQKCQNDLLFLEAHFAVEAYEKIGSPCESLYPRSAKGSKGVGVTMRDVQRDECFRQYLEGGPVYSNTVDDFAPGLRATCPDGLIACLYSRHSTIGSVIFWVKREECQLLHALAGKLCNRVRACMSS